ncbi:hypothetical protein EZV62_023222 [Acer yangbiense]|uniref:RING-type E3 ubiquitin transferase n=1 Tax=Acer yangbiense TaxID=1000413 RepID=A0A5C7H0Z2_9ROSI|nr:hypothetical protein EZV62_023222 [Acer yangbiense]
MWDGIFFCIGGTFLYVCGATFDSTIDDIKMAKRVNKLKDLAQLFNTESKFSPLVVISGRVGSETPIICDYSPLTGVIVEKTDDGTGRAFVMGARYSRGSVLIAEKEVFDGSVGSRLNEKLGFPTGIKILGVDHVERLLPIGASMTVIGQVVKDDTGIIKVQHPYEGHLFYVGRLTVDELIADLGIVGVFMIAKHAVQCILGKRLGGKSQRRIKDQPIQICVKPKRLAVVQFLCRKWTPLGWVLSDGPKRLAQDVKGSYGKAENESDRATKDRQMPGLRMIGLEQEYNPRLIFKFSVH